MTASRISVVTPTFRRPDEVRGLLLHFNNQTVLPFEVVLVDGSPAGEDASQHVVEQVRPDLKYPLLYIRRGGGTAIQRNIGIDHATGDFIAFVDDDIRLYPDFFERMLEAYARPDAAHVGGIAGYIVNQFLDPAKSPRWRWYRRFRLFTTYEPGRYDYQSGYPINRYLQPPHEGIRDIEFMGSGCVVWRREVFERGLRFSSFFADYGVLEDAHLALRAGREWKLWEYGKARCTHDHAPGGRVNSRRVAWKSAVNYRFVFIDIVPHRTWTQEWRFWRVQFFDLFRMLAHALRANTRTSWHAVLGKVEGIAAAARLRPSAPAAQEHASRRRFA